MPQLNVVERSDRSALSGGPDVIDPCKANVHEFVSEKSECIPHFWPRQSNQFIDDEFQRRVNVFIIFGHGRAPNSSFQRRLVGYSGERFAGFESKERLRSSEIKEDGLRFVERQRDDHQPYQSLWF